MRKIQLADMIHAEGVELLKRTCHYCDRDYSEHVVGDIDGYHSYRFCPSHYGQTFVSQLLMLGDAFLVDDVEFDSVVESLMNKDT